MKKIFILAWKKCGTGINSIFLFLVFSLICPSFLHKDNLSSLLSQASVIGIATIGMTFVMILGNVDLSIGSIIAVVAVISSLIMTNTMLGMEVAIIVGILVGVAAGAMNGVLIVAFRLSSFATTLGTMYFWSGVANVLSRGKIIRGLPVAFRSIAHGKVLGEIPIAFVIYAAMIAIAIFLITRTYFGKFIYAIGCNRGAARASGISLTRMTIYTHMICGFFCGVTGIVRLSRTMGISPYSTENYAFDCIIAACLGGISFQGGRGSIHSSVLGVLTVFILLNGLTLLQVNSFWQKAIKGLLFIIALAIDAYNTKYRKLEEH